MKRIIKKPRKEKTEVMFNCENGHSDCKKVEQRFHNCNVCNDYVWKIYEVVRLEENPHLPAIYKEVAQEVRERHWERNKCDIYKVSVELVSKVYVSDDFGNRSHWKFTFKVDK